MFRYKPKRYMILLSVVLLVVIGLGACSGIASQTQQVSNPSVSTTANQATAISTQEQPLAPETNPVGDIPDTQVFVNYVDSAGHYSLDVPEGWAQTNNGADVQFVDKFDGLSVSVTHAGSAPTSNTVDANEIRNLASSGRAFQVGQVTEMDLPGGHAVKISATVNSEPDPVTSKQVRLEEDIYLFYHNDSEAMLQLWAPQGADNVDQWNRISKSFQWK